MESPIYILGAGNLGKYVAHALRQHAKHRNITFLFTRPREMEEFKAWGRSIECVNPDGTVDVTGGFRSEFLRENTILQGRRFDSLVVATKGYETDDALRRIQKRVRRRTDLLFLENGLGMSKCSQQNACFGRLTMSGL